LKDVERVKKDDCRSRVFGTRPKEEEILVNHAEGVINKIRNRPSAYPCSGGGGEEDGGL
jgi:hypothetical protein